MIWLLFHEMNIHGCILLDLFVDGNTEESVEEDVGVVRFFQADWFKIGNNFCAGDVKV